MTVQCVYAQPDMSQLHNSPQAFALALQMLVAGRLRNASLLEDRTPNLGIPGQGRAQLLSLRGWNVSRVHPCLNAILLSIQVSFSIEAKVRGCPGRRRSPSPSSPWASKTASLSRSPSTVTVTARLKLSLTAPLQQWQWDL